MAYQPPTYGGLLLFGINCRVTQQKTPNAVQVTTYFGANGVQSLDGGTRGRTFMVDGQFISSTPAGCMASLAAMEQYADGQARDFTDTTGADWPNVVYRNDAQQTGPILTVVGGGGFLMPYRLTLHGLT